MASMLFDSWLLLTTIFATVLMSAIVAASKEDEWASCVSIEQEKTAQNFVDSLNYVLCSLWVIVGFTLPVGMLYSVCLCMLFYTLSKHILQFLFFFPFLWCFINGFAKKKNEKQ